MNRQQRYHKKKKKKKNKNRGKIREICKQYYEDNIKGLPKKNRD